MTRIKVLDANTREKLEKNVNNYIEEQHLFIKNVLDIKILTVPEKNGTIIYMATIIYNS